MPCVYSGTGYIDVGGLEGAHIHVACSIYYIKKVSIRELQVQERGWGGSTTQRTWGKRRATKMRKSERRPVDGTHTVVCMASCNSELGKKEKKLPSHDFWCFSPL